MHSRAGLKFAYTVEEAAHLLSLSRAKLYRLIDSCEIGSILIGRSRRITFDQLQAFVSRYEDADASQALRLRSMNGLLGGKGTE